jgi:hypothetical protein
MLFRLFKIDPKMPLLSYLEKMGQNSLQCFTIYIFVLIMKQHADTGKVKTK